MVFLLGCEEESVERGERGEGGGVDEAAPRAADGVERGRRDEGEAEVGDVVGEARE